MAAPKDEIGNDVEVGDYCLVDVGGKMMLAKVYKIDQGGLLIGQGNRQMPGKLSLNFEIHFGFTPGGGKKVRGVWKLEMPQREEDTNLPLDEVSNKPN